MRKWSTDEIIKVIDAMIGRTEPAGDSSIDHVVEDNVRTLIDVMDGCLDRMYEAAKYRKSEYGSQRDVGERAYAAMLEWRDWLNDKEEELA